MTPEEQAKRHMPGRERVPWRQLSWDHYAKLWVHLGIRRVSNADIAFFEDTDGTEVDVSLVQRFVQAISKTVPILICAAVLTGREVAGHGAVGELRPAFDSVLAASGGFRAHETPGGAYLWECGGVNCAGHFTPPPRNRIKAGQLSFAAVAQDTDRTHWQGADRESPCRIFHPAPSRLPLTQRVSPEVGPLRFLSTRENL